jgi:hypothetical protein
MEISGQLDSNQLYSEGKTSLPVEQEGGRFGEERNIFFRIVQPVDLHHPNNEDVVNSSDLYLQTSIKCYCG